MGQVGPELAAHILGRWIILETWLRARRDLLQVLIARLQFNPLLLLLLDGRRSLRDCGRGLITTRGGKGSGYRINLAYDSLEFCEAIQELTVLVATRSSVLFARWKNALQATADTVWAGVDFQAFDLALTTIGAGQGVSFARMVARGTLAATHLPILNSTAQPVI